MKKRVLRLWGCIFCLNLFFSCQTEIPELNVIPLPADLSLGKGTFTLHAKTVLIVPENQDIRFCGAYLNQIIADKFGYALSVQSGKKSGAAIQMQLDASWPDSLKEGYRLQIEPEAICLTAGSAAGLFYGVQTLGQLLQDRQFLQTDKQAWKLPVLLITDHPAFPYRGLHLDVSRHFFPKEFIMKCLDWMAVYKLNRFHWHLTDAAGWRLEMVKYPQLTEVAAWRPDKDYLEWWNTDRRYLTKDSANAYGGFYTRREIREIVAYAAERHITIIPEIEMPGHSEEVLAVFPELGCSGKPYTNGEFCIGKEKTFEFIENVLDEVMDLFPSEYIHIGGDEASKTTWRGCSLCQKRIKDLYLKDEKGLQSYMIRRVGQYLASKGRKLIGWDEILEGGLPSGATVMSWRGEKGGIEAARAGLDVIMTPGAYCYFDSYQAEPRTQPYAIGGFTPYLKTYSYHPVPKVLNTQEGRHIIGAQANLWTEYIPTAEHAEYMIFPRLLALSEVVWSPLEKRNPEDFKRRVAWHIPFLHSKGVNAFTLSDRIDILTEVDTAGQRIKVWFDSEKYKPEIRYTMDGTPPSSQSLLYQNPFYITDSAFICAAIFTGGQPSELLSDARLDYHKAIGKKVTYKNRYSGSYPAAGETTLTDGYRGGLTYSDGRWQGFLRHIDIVIDMDTVTDLHYVSAKFMQLTGPGVYMPHYVSVSVSEDGNTFREVGKIRNDVPAGEKELVLKDFTARFSARGRYIRFFAKKQAGFQFIDEIVVY